ncbi:hypothetical protein LRS05_00185 [Flavobacterium sp. J372]|uniref:hypothetical protein n=1 Tax=Flavobacterium sp. J372 TaxID=2898436 RepID=UPI0021513349|nr:hypothetical protein [Flavobacterium sp. J372]MCR5860673.1 hypothetical protein [Flavobacterium sp. J372]
MTVEVLQQIEDNSEQDRFTTVVYQASWHKGGIGIMASRLRKPSTRPTLVFTKSGDKLGGIRTLGQRILIFTMHLKPAQNISSNLAGICMRQD